VWRDVFCVHTRGSLASTISINYEFADWGKETLGFLRWKVTPLRAIAR
jgi:hypothetical protein